MFKVREIDVCREPVCKQPVLGKYIRTEEVNYFDKDGFELTPLEQEYYKVNGFQNKIGSGVLYHTCWQEPWFTKTTEDNFIVDHTMILHRCSFEGDAAIQLYKHSKKLPQLLYLINCKKKWGLDFSLDYFNPDDNKIYEIIHIEQDTGSYDHFLELKNSFEEFVLTTDWSHATKVLLKEKHKWLTLEGMARNDWKAKFFGYEQAEVTLKSI